MADRNQNEGSGQQPPIRQDNDNQSPSTGQPGLNRQTDQELEQTGGQISTGQDSPGGDTAILNEGTEPDLGGSDTGGFVGSQGEKSDDYLQRGGNPESGFAEQGRGAPDQGDIERTGERSENRDSDIEGGSGAV